MRYRHLAAWLLVLLATCAAAADSLGEQVLLRWQEGDRQRHALLDLLADRLVLRTLDGPAISWQRQAAPAGVVHGRREGTPGPWSELRASRRGGELLGQFLPDGPTWRGQVVGTPEEQLDEARALQLQRDPWPALLLYTSLWQRYPERGDLGAPALVHAIEVLQSLADDQRALAIYRDTYGDRLADLPPLNGRSGLDIERSRQLLESWQAAQPETPPPSADEAVEPAGQPELDQSAEWRLQLTALAGSRRRFVRSQQIERDPGEIFDARASLRWRWQRDFDAGALGAGEATTAFGLSGGTDDLATEAGRGLIAAWGSHLVRTPSFMWPFNHFGVAGGAGHSDERGTLVEADLVLSLLHLGYERDDDGHCFAYGLGCRFGDPDDSYLALVWDRLHDRPDDGERRLASRTRLEGRRVFAGGFFLEGELIYLRHALLPDGRDDNRWSTGIGVGWRHTW